MDEPEFAAAFELGGKMSLDEVFALLST